MRSDFVIGNATVEKLKVFFAEQDRWMRSMIRNHSMEEDAYWRHVAYILAQFDGLYAGYRAAALPEWVRWYCCCEQALLLIIQARKISFEKACNR